MLIIFSFRVVPLCGMIPEMPHRRAVLMAAPRAVVQ